MTAIALQKQNIYRGNLILVNREYGYVEKTLGFDPVIMDYLVPVQEQSPVLLRRQAAVLLTKLMEEIQGWRRIAPVSGWRSLGEQQKLWDGSMEESGEEFTRKYVAVPGHSEHQTGLAIDLGLKQEDIDFIRPHFPYVGICQTFRRRAAEYGFIQRYPYGKTEITGIGHEPWHFRYVGVPHAVVMEEKNLTLEEYITFVREFPYGQKPYEFCMEGREIRISYLRAEPGEYTKIEIDRQAPYSVSGNNIDGFIITEWGKRYE